MTITVTNADEQWLRREIVKELMNHFNYSKEKALSLFKDSPLPKMIYSDPDYIFHYDPEYWAALLVKARSDKTHILNSYGTKKISKNHASSRISV